MSIIRARGAHPAHGPDRPRRRGRTTRPLRRIAAALTSAALGLGVALVGVAAPASAHTGDLKAVAVCNPTTGEYDVTYTLKLTGVGNNLTGTTKWRVDGDSRFDGTPTSDRNMDRGPLSSKGNTTLTLGTVSLPGTTTGDGPWVYAYTTWNDGYGKGSDGRVEGLKGDCGGGNESITYCHASGQSGNYQRITTSVSAFYNSGHINHKNDIFPAFSFVKQGHRISVEAQGDQTLLQYEDCVKLPTLVPVNGVPTFEDTCLAGDDVVTLPSDTDALAWTKAKSGKAWTVTVTAKEGFVFPQGARTSWTFTADEGPCVIELHGVPTFTDICGPDNENLVVPDDTISVDWSSSRNGDVITVTAAAKPGYAFSGQPQLTWTYPVDDKPCLIRVEGAPTFQDRCGAGNHELVVPEDTSTIEWEHSIENGIITVTATAKPGSEFPEGATTTWTFTINDAPCLTELTGTPSFTDICGPDNETLVVPADTDQVDWESVREGDVITVTATPKSDWAFSGEPKTVWTYDVRDTECVEPTLAGSVATGECLADVPWISYHVALTDPDAQADSHTVFLVLTDGEHTERIELGDLDEAGVLEGRTLWPGASVDGDGNPTGWPGWEQLADGSWVETDGNFAWTRDITTATFEVNPELTVDLAYPPATPNCATGPTFGDGDDSTPAAVGSGLASTGFAGGTIAIVAGVIVVLGAAVVAIAAIRRKRAAAATTGERTPTE